jgi:uncharacterized protein YjbI with pentapeptide repeats
MNLSRVDFTDAILDGANLSHADVRGAIFRGSSLVGANLQFVRAGIASDRLVVLHSIILFLALLLGILAGFIGSSTMGLLLDESQVFSAYRHVKFWLSWHSVSGLLALSYIIIYGGMLWWQHLPIAMMLVISSFIILGTIVAAIIINACIQSNCDWEFVGQMVISIEGAASLPIFQTIFTTLALAIFIEILARSKAILIAVGIGICIALISIVSASSSLFVCLGSVTIAISIIYLGWTISRRVRSELVDYAVLRRISTYLRTYFGTCFDRANLTDANLQSARLANTNLRAACLSRTNIYGVDGIDTAKLDRTILTDPRVRQLLTNFQGANGDYTGCNFQGAYLVGADLTDANLTNANLNSIELQQSRLDGANLTRISGWGANFSGASLTGACIADWSIDRTTCLEETRCEYVYLKVPGIERNPASGSFRAGDFARLYQEVWNTVDLIFHHGIDWAAFSTAWQQLQVENAGIPLAIHSIEHKGVGTIVVKVEVPIDTDKSQLHQDFDRSYQLLLQAVEDRYRVELAGRDRELSLYREQQERLQNILQSLVKPSHAPRLERLVTLKLTTKDRDGNLGVNVEIGDRGMTPSTAAVGSLADKEEVILAYRDWQIAYRNYLDRGTRIEIPDKQITNISRANLLANCQITAKLLTERLNAWLDAESFKPIKELMLQELHPSQSIQIILQTDNPQLRQLPLQLWNFFDRFTHAELTLASDRYHSIAPPRSLDRTTHILAILGNSQGIDLIPDRELLANLADTHVEFLVEPTRQLLTDKLWERDWEIIFFAGHSGSDPSLTTGYLKINATERLTIPELKYALERSISNGLKLAIVNSCDGLGLAAELIAIQLPQVIVMREPVPDLVAQKFLAYLTIAFASGKPLYLAVREARTRLQGLEDKYLCATWLPVLYQNPANIDRY